MYKVLIRISIPVIALAYVLLFTTYPQAQIARGANKFLGNITTSFEIRSDFITYWNQITGENEHKWEFIEETRDIMDWSKADAIANYAKEHNIPWKFHALVWGNQYPKWMNELSTNEQREEIIEWLDAAAQRYPDVQMIDVVNEAYMSDPNNWEAKKHYPIPFRDALGGIGSTGYDWVINSFKMARERWPDAILIINDYNTLEWDDEINWVKNTIPKLLEAGAPIDAVGFQGHELRQFSADVLKARLDEMHDVIRLPMFITEYDIRYEDDQLQLERYKTVTPVLWNHPGIVGITLWGYIYGSTWYDGTGGLIRDGQERPAMTWLKEFIKENPDPPNNYPDLLNLKGSSVTGSDQKKTNNQINIRQNGSQIIIRMNAGAGKSPACIDIYDLKGNLVRSSEIRKKNGFVNNYILNTTAMPKGYYIINVNNGEKINKAGFAVFTR